MLNAFKVKNLIAVDFFVAKKIQYSFVEVISCQKLSGNIQKIKTKEHPKILKEINYRNKDRIIMIQSKKLVQALKNF